MILLKIFSVLFVIGLFINTKPKQCELFGLAENCKTNIIFNDITKNKFGLYDIVERQNVGNNQKITYGNYEKEINFKAITYEKQTLYQKDSIIVFERKYLFSSIINHQKIKKYDDLSLLSYHKFNLQNSQYFAFFYEKSNYIGTTPTYNYVIVVEILKNKQIKLYSIVSIDAFEPEDIFTDYNKDGYLDFLVYKYIEDKNSTKAAICELFSIVNGKIVQNKDYYIKLQKKDNIGWCIISKKWY
jgi:hypothetical protein